MKDLAEGAGEVGLRAGFGGDGVEGRREGGLIQAPGDQADQVAEPDPTHLLASVTDGAAQSAAEGRQHQTQGAARGREHDPGTKPSRPDAGHPGGFGRQFPGGGDFAEEAFRRDRRGFRERLIATDTITADA